MATKAGNILVERRKFLVIDREQEAGIQYVSSLEKEGHAVHWSTNCDDAVKWYLNSLNDEQPYDLSLIRYSPESPSFHMVALFKLHLLRESFCALLMLPWGGADVEIHKVESGLIGLINIEPIQKNFEQAVYTLVRKGSRL